MSSCSSCCSTFWKSNRWRHISALFCLSVTIVLTLMMLIATSTNVTERISWSNFEYHFLVSRSSCTGDNCPTWKRDYVVNVGLLTSQKCWYNDKEATWWSDACEDVPSPSVIDGADLANAGRGVITANSFGMLFTVLAVLMFELFVYMPKWAQKLKFPRIILFILCFLMLTMYIVSVATWFQMANDKIASGAAHEAFTNRVGTALIDKVTAGYAVAVNVFIIALAFFGWVFIFLRVQFPNHAETDSTAVEGVGMTSEVGKAISMQYQPPAVTLSPSQAMGAYNAYNSVNSPQQEGQKRGFFR